MLTEWSEEEGTRLWGSGRNTREGKLVEKRRNQGSIQKLAALKREKRGWRSLSHLTKGCGERGGGSVARVIAKRASSKGEGDKTKGSSARYKYEKLKNALLTLPGGPPSRSCPEGDRTDTSSQRKRPFRRGGST